MTDALLFADLDKPRDFADRLFFGLFPPPEIAAEIAAQSLRLRRMHGMAGWPVATDRLHVTLAHIGDFAGLPPGVVAGAMQAAAAVYAAPFEVTFDRAMSFSGQSGNLPFVLRNDDTGPLMDFQRRLCAALIRAGVRHKAGARFTPHITLSRDAISVPIEPTGPISWIASEFVLIHSLIGKTQHIPLGRWPLGDR